MTETLTRALIAEKVQVKMGFSFSESSELVDSLIDEMCDGLKNEEVLKISSFGTFKVKKKKERIGRNPKTKEEKVISSRKAISFYSSNLLNEKINN